MKAHDLGAWLAWRVSRVFVGSDKRGRQAVFKLVRKGGFEPPRLSAPPPQDGVSASSTTSALCK